MTAGIKMHAIEQHIAHARIFNGTACACAIPPRMQLGARFVGDVTVRHQGDLTTGLARARRA